MKKLAHQKKKAGRPTVRTKSNQKKILDIYKIGGTQKEAAAAVKISTRALSAWENEDQDFFFETQAAKNYANIAAKNVVVTKIAKGSAPNARWWLEKKLPDEFGGRAQVEIDARQQQINLGSDDDFTDRLAGFLRGANPRPAEETGD